MKRTRISEGVFQDQYGLAAVVKVGKVQREKRFPTGTNLDLLRSWRIGKRAELDQERGDAIAAVAGTLERDAQKFLKRKEGTAYYKAARSHLKAWNPKFGTWLRSRILRDDVERQIAAWREAKVSARTIRHRCFLLRELYHALDGPKARTPVDYIKLPKLPAPHPVAVPLKTVQRVAANLLKAKLMVDYARFLVRATTGQRPAQIMRATADDVDLKRKIWFVKPAKGGLAVPLPLNADMVTAWKLFAKADAWGAFDTGRAADTLREHGWPKDVRPYALRHTFAISLLLNGVGLDDVQGLLGHGQIQTTRLYYAPILVSRLRAATSHLPAYYQRKPTSRKRKTA
jgi:integrase